MGERLLPRVQIQKAFGVLKAVVSGLYCLELFWTWDNWGSWGGEWEGSGGQGGVVSRCCGESAVQKPNMPTGSSLTGMLDSRVKEGINY